MKKGDKVLVEIDRPGAQPGDDEVLVYGVITAETTTHFMVVHRMNWKGELFPRNSTRVKCLPRNRQS